LTTTFKKHAIPPSHAKRLLDKSADKSMIVQRAAVQLTNTTPNN